MNTGHIATRKALTLTAADVIAQTAEAEATRRGAKVVIVVVDDGGNPIVLRRLDYTQVASEGVGIDRRAPRRSSGDLARCWRSRCATGASARYPATFVGVV